MQQQKKTNNMAGWLGGAIQGITSLIGGGIDTHNNNINARKQREHEMQLAKYNNAKNIEFWNMQNEYNDPKRTMARMKEAGINPQALAGQGAQPAGAIPASSARSSGAVPKSEVGKGLAGLGTGIANAYQMSRQQKMDEVQTNYYTSLANLNNKKAETEDLNQAIKSSEKLIRGYEANKAGIMDNYQRDFANMKWENLRLKNQQELQKIQGTKIDYSIKLGKDERQKLITNADLALKGKQAFKLTLQNEMQAWINDYQKKNEKKFGQAWEVGEIFWKFMNDTGLTETITDKGKEAVEQMKQWFAEANKRDNANKGKWEGAKAGFNYGIRKY